MINYTTQPLKVSYFALYTLKIKFHSLYLQSRKLIELNVYELISGEDKINTRSPHQFLDYRYLLKPVVTQYLPVEKLYPQFYPCLVIPPQIDIEDITLDEDRIDINLILIHIHKLSYTSSSSIFPYHCLK